MNMDAIFTFHSIDERATVLSYRPDDLRAFVEALREEGARFATLDEILAPRESDAPRVALSFDDGIATVHRAALPLLTDLGVPAIAFVVPEWVGRHNGWPGQPVSAPRYELMSWSELRELQAAGFEIGCHSANHLRLRRLAPEVWRTELAGGRAKLEDELGVPVRHFAYPYGVHDAEAVRRVRDLYDTAVTTEMRFLGKGADVHRLPRIDSHYLRDPKRHAPLFGARTRRMLAARAWLRRLKGWLARP
ncbi:MAG: hypothetical protein E2O39_07665 [Planctomycetota bacterium]|nr:MAG: hypothetical protein E2O39_07665 [Planctomycetota bacterium]